MEERSEAGGTLPAFLVAHRDEIVAELTDEIRRLPRTEILDEEQLRDNMPRMIERVAEAIARLLGGLSPEQPTETAQVHASERLEHGFDLPEVLHEYALLRLCIMRVWSRREHRPLDPLAVAALHEAIDVSMLASARRFLLLRDRALLALDKMNIAALEARSLEDLLQSFLQVFMKTAPHVDSAAILLREHDRLVVRAAAGLVEEMRSHFSVRVGEGFSGKIAETRRDLMLRDAAHDPLVTGRTFHERGIRALYGVPLLVGDELVGVAHMGSVTAYEFAAQDRQLFRSLATRAAAAILQFTLREQAERFAQESRAAIRQREDILAIVSHDLRNPLSAVVSAASLISRLAAAARSDSARRVRRHAETILRGASRMERLIQDLLDLASVQAGRLSIRRDPVPANELLIEAVREAAATAKQKDVTIRAGSTRDHGAILCDRHRILQVLANLIGNAIKAVHAGGHIDVSIAPAEGAIVFAVKDDGHGISREELPHIFDRYWRGQHAGYRGSGLGLAISAGIVAAHGGRIWAESEPEKGSTFRFSLPA